MKAKNLSNGLHGLKITVNKKFKSISAVIKYMTDPAELEAKMYLSCWGLNSKDLTPKYLLNGEEKFIKKNGEEKNDFNPWFIMTRIAEIQTSKKVTAKSLTTFKETAKKSNDGEALEFIKIIEREEAAAAERIKKNKERNEAAKKLKEEAAKKLKEEAAKKLKEEAAKKLKEEAAKKLKEEAAKKLKEEKK